MKIYLAGRYGRRIELQVYADALRVKGHHITSSWLEGTPQLAEEEADPELLSKWAETDLDDIMTSEAILLFTEEPNSTVRIRGGRLHEFGYAMGVSDLAAAMSGRALHLYIVGPREHIFMHCRSVTQFPTWGKALEYFSTPMD